MTPSAGSCPADEFLSPAAPATAGFGLSMSVLCLWFATRREIAGLS